MYATLLYTLLGPCSAAPMLVCCYREASQHQELASPQQFGIWEVEGLGIVIAFRGTSTWNDILIDVNVRPVLLSPEQGASLSS